MSRLCRIERAPVDYSFTDQIGQCRFVDSVIGNPGFGGMDRWGRIRTGLVLNLNWYVEDHDRNGMTSRILCRLQDERSWDGEHFGGPNVRTGRSHIDVFRGWTFWRISPKRPFSMQAEPRTRKR
jgi:hypothetical protein